MEVQIINENTIKDKIHIIRGVKVMLDYDLAEIYGYTTKAFNQQVKNNISKFDEDFRFELTRDEVELLSMSKKLTSIQTKGIKGGRTKPLFAFTESGIYMLMTVLKGERATAQSKDAGNKNTTIVQLDDIEGCRNMFEELYAATRSGK